MSLAHPATFEARPAVESEPSIYRFGDIDLSQVSGTDGDPGKVAVVHPRALNRECLVQTLQEFNPDISLCAVASLEELRNVRSEIPVSAILLVLGEKRTTDPAVMAELQDLVVSAGTTPVVVVAEADDPAAILAALEAGVRGYLLTSSSAKVIGEAIAVARSGGEFVPAATILGMKHVIGNGHEKPSLSDPFTGRQRAVANAIRQGKPNKIIAYELNMCESTVKVHIRSIMKKLKATNRTEIAYKLTQMLGLED
jgi:DNA-binding NarL/FixJ family response regulator